jgi:hypothetical protein
MNYELAKELEEAGFPQGGKGSWTLPPDRLLARRTDRVYVPTLTELIEACGDHFGSLHRGHDPANWWASGCDEASGNSLGKSAEEAVARLWLSLNNGC